MNMMDIFALVAMLLGFVLGFAMATRAALDLLAKKDAIIQEVKAAVKAQHAVAENYREVLQKYFRNFPSVMAKLEKELNRRDKFDPSQYESHDLADEVYCRFLFDEDFCVKDSVRCSNTTGLKPVSFKKPVLRPVNVMLPMVIDLNKQVNNQWPKFFDELDEIEDPEPYWDNLVIPTESSVKVSKAHYNLLEKRTEYGGKKTKWSTVNGREFGAKRKFKMKRSQARANKRSQKESWLAFNELYEDDLPYEVEEVILQNKAQSFKKALNELTLEEFLLAK